MGKRILTYSFLIGLVLALMFLVFHENTSIRETMDRVREKEARITIDNFVIYRFKDMALESKLSARIGKLFEPNRIELYGDIKGEQHKGQTKEVVSAESAVSLFDTEGMMSLFSKVQPKMIKSELSGLVEVETRDHLLLTDYAVYFGETQMFESRHPVRVDGPDRVLQGEKGFKYNLENKELELHQVSAVLQNTEF